MKRTIGIVCALCAAAGLRAAPEVADVSVDQDDAAKCVRVGYTLAGGDAIVTVAFEVQTAGGDWTAVPEERYADVCGDVNRLVSAGAERKIVWRPGDGWDAAAARFRATVKAWTPSDPPQYMAVALEPASPGAIAYYASSNAIPGGATDVRYKTSWLLFRHIRAKGATFRMGTNASDVKNIGIADTQHEVSFTRDWWMAVYETTQAQHRYATGESPSFYTLQGDTRPVERVSYNMLRAGSDNNNPDASVNWPATGHGTVADTSIIKKWRDKTGLQVDLPTEAEWEYSARAGSGASIYTGQFFDAGAAYKNATAAVARFGTGTEDASLLPENGGTDVVGNHVPNAWGLYDMIGNVCEICLDWYSDESYTETATDPAGPASGTTRVRRGGCYRLNAWTANLCRRQDCGLVTFNPENGYRLAIVIE